MAVSNRLTRKQIISQVGKRLLKNEKLNFLENFAMFMGKAQIVEMALKQRLVNEYAYDEDEIERWTLGTAIKELEKCGLRKDFIALLDELNEHRKYIAHDLLAGDALMRNLIGPEAQRFAWKSLQRGLYAVEVVIVVHDFLYGHSEARGLRQPRSNPKRAIERKTPTQTKRANAQRKHPPR
jgi:hypothetical protein